MRWLCRCKVSISDGLADIGGPTTNTISWPSQPGRLSIGLRESDAIECELITAIAAHIFSILAACLLQYCDGKIMQGQRVLKSQLSGGLVEDIIPEFDMSYYYQT